LNSRHQDFQAIRYLPDMFKKLIAQNILRQNGDIRKGWQADARERRELRFSGIEFP